MSKGLEQLKDDLEEKSDRKGGATLTKDAKNSTINKLAEHLHDNGFNITQADQLKPKHVESYAQDRLQNVSTRTLHNELGHIRKILEAAGKDKMAKSERLSNSKLCGGKADRSPAREAPDRDTKEKIIEEARERDAGVGAALRLQAELGLRPREAVQGAQSLKTWQRQLERGYRVTVAFGSKGGRPREVSPPDRQAALAAVREAREIAAQRGGRLVVGRSGTLRSAMSRFSRVAHAAGARGRFAPHSFRYSWTQDRIKTYQNQGFSRQEARSLTAQDLGHGDSRGRWVASVYGRE